MSDLARARRWVRIRSRGIPPRRDWEPLRFFEAEYLRVAALSNGVPAGELIRTLIVHRARVRLERAGT